MTFLQRQLGGPGSVQSRPVRLFKSQRRQRELRTVPGGLRPKWRCHLHSQAGVTLWPQSKCRGGGDMWAAPRVVAEYCCLCPRGLPSSDRGVGPFLSPQSWEKGFGGDGSEDRRGRSTEQRSAEERGELKGGENATKGHLSLSAVSRREFVFNFQHALTTSSQASKWSLL